MTSNGKEKHLNSLKNGASKRRKSSNVRKEEDDNKLDKSLVHFEIEGVSKISDSKTYWGKALWLFLLLAALTIAIYEVVKTVTDYYNSPIVTSYKIVTKNEMQFPQIYLCPSNKIRQNYLDANRSHFERVQHMLQTYVYKTEQNKTRQKRNIFQDMGFDEENMRLDEEQFYRFKRDLSNNFTDNGTHSHNNMSAANFPPLADNNTFDYFRQIYLDMGILQSEFFVGCQFREDQLKVVTCQDIITAVVDPDYGRCYVIDLGNRTQATPAQGLIIVLNLRTYDYPHESNLQPKYDGVLVSVSKKYDPTNFEKVLLPANSFNKIDIFAQHLSFLNVDSGPAKQLCDEGEFEFKILNATYSVPACQRECFFRTVVNRCKCMLATDPLFINNVTIKENKFCTMAEIHECVQPNVTDSEDAQSEIDACNQDCKIPCESWRFNTRVSQMVLLDVPFKGLTANTTMRDIVYAHFAFPYLEYDEFTQDESMSINDMIGNMGGQIGLWTGASMLTLIQIPITFFTLSGYHFYKSATPKIKEAKRRFTVA